MRATLSNPAFSETIFDRVREEERETPTTMTVEGTAIKTMVLMAILLVAAAITWWQVLTPIEVAVEAGKAVSRFAVSANIYLFIIVGLIGGLIMALVTMFVPRISPFTAPVYAAFEGVALGAISAWFETIYPNIVLEAVALTTGVLVALLVLYSFRILQATPRFQKIVIAATAAIFLVYLVSFVLRLFGVGVPYIHDSGPIGIGFSLVVVVIAALNLILDFNFIEQNARRGAPRYMEWYSGFALLVTLVWLYLEVLKLLAKLRDRR